MSQRTRHPRDYCHCAVVTHRLARGLLAGLVRALSDAMSRLQTDVVNRASLFFFQVPRPRRCCAVRAIFCVCGHESTQAILFGWP